MAIIVCDCDNDTDVSAKPEDHITYLDKPFALALYAKSEVFRLGESIRIRGSAAFMHRIADAIKENVPLPEAEPVEVRDAAG